MKKSVIIGGTAALLLAGSAAAFFCASSTQCKAISDFLSKHQEPLSDTERMALDLSGDGKITRADWFRAKLRALLPFTGDAAVLYSAADAMPIGRTAYHEDTRTLWCSLSGSGAAFTFTGRECAFELVADANYQSGALGAVRYAVYVNEEQTEEGQLTEPTRTVTVHAKEGAPATVRVIKLSESAQSSFGIRDLLVRGKSEKSLSLCAADQVNDAYQYAHRIEFIGDSITCGYGVDGKYGTDTFQTANEDVTKAYAYRTAQKLGAAYSMVSYSGHGIISGYTGNGKINTAQLVPRYYGQVGHSSALVEGKHKIQDDLWDFPAEQAPDLVVINLGTNDASYTGSDSAKQAEFSAEYVKFLKTVREKNPDAHILCTLGIMGTTLCDAVENAVTVYQKETGDDRIASMRFDLQQEADGFAVDWHPSAATHEKAAEKLSEYIRLWLKWE